MVAAGQACGQALSVGVVAVRAHRSVRTAAWPLLGMSVALQFIEQRSQLTVTVLSAGCAIAASIVHGPARPPRAPLALVLYFVWCALSITWSDLPGTTLGGVIQHLGMLMVAVVLASRVRSWEDYRAIAWWWGTLYISVVSAAAVLAPERVRHQTGELMGNFRGLAGHKSAFGTFVLLAIVGVLCGRGSEKIPSIARYVTPIVAAVGLWMLWQSQSTTALIGAVLSGSITLLIYVARQTEGASIATIALSLPIAAILGYGVTFADASQSVGKDSTLTGRTVVWAAVQEQVQQRPFVGYGFKASWEKSTGATRAIWGEVRARGMGDWRPGIAHNSALEVLLGVGFIGLALVLAVILPTMIATLRLAVAGDFPSATSLLPLLQTSIFLAYSISERGIGQDQGFLVLAIVACCVSSFRSDVSDKVNSGHATTVAASEGTAAPFNQSVSR